MEENNQNGYANEEVKSNVETNEREEVKVGEVVGNGYSDTDKEANKLMAVLCYLSLLVLIPYFGEKESKWVRHHAIQGLNLLIIELIGGVIGIFGFLGNMISTIISIYAFVVSIMGIIQVLNGEEKELPLLNKFQFIKK